MLASRGLLVLLGFLLTGCSVLLGPPPPTPLPSEFLPTAIALTLQADPANRSLPNPVTPPAGTPSGELAAAASITPSPSPQSTAAPSPTPGGPTATPYTLQPPPSPTPTPGIPNAAIEIRNLGAYSKITSPLHVYTYLKPGAGGRVRIELIGEDGRILVRNIKTMDFVPTGAWAVMSLDLDFEISAAAEAAWLKISVDDEFGRTVALNSVPLILLSIGDPDIVPPLDLLAPIIIREPNKRTLIQGGKLLVTGLARPGSQTTLVARLVTAKGEQVGMRVGSVESLQPGAHGEFAMEVPYQISSPTKALLTVTASTDDLSDIIYLSSIEVILSP